MSPSPAYVLAACSPSASGPAAPSSSYTSKASSRSPSCACICATPSFARAPDSLGASSVACSNAFSAPSRSNAFAFSSPSATACSARFAGGNDGFRDSALRASKLSGSSPSTPSHAGRASAWRSSAVSARAMPRRARASGAAVSTWRYNSSARACSPRALAFTAPANNNSGSLPSMMPWRTRSQFGSSLPVTLARRERSGSGTRSSLAARSSSARSASAVRPFALRSEATASDGRDAPSASPAVSNTPSSESRGDSGGAAPNSFRAGAEACTSTSPSFASLPFALPAASAFPLAS